MYRLVKGLTIVSSVCVGAMLGYFFAPESGWLSLIWPPSIKTWGFMSLVLLVIGAIILQGLKNIPANPPYRAVVTRLGRRTTKVKKEGWRLFLFYPYWHDYILVNMTKVNYDLPPQLVRTPDMAEVEIPISLTWTPLDKETEDCETRKTINGLINYLNAGGEKGVKEIIDDIVRERLREWAMSKIEGPKTWEQALGAREEAINVLIKSIAGEAIDPIDSNIPTCILLRFFNSSSKDFQHKVKPAPTSEEEIEEEANWALLEENLATLGEEGKNKLIQEVIERKETIAKMRQGNGGKALPQLGIRLDRLNIDEIKPKGKLAESAEKMVMEQRDAKGDQIRIGNISERIKELQKLGFGPEQALEIVQTERGKVTKNISETKFNLSAETRKMIEKLAPDILTKIFEKK